MTFPSWSSQRSRVGFASSVNRHISSSASAASTSATRPAMVSRWISRSTASSRRLRQSRNAHDRPIVAIRSRISSASASGPSASASSSRSRRLAARLPDAIPTSISASRCAPRTSRFAALRVLLVAMLKSPPLGWPLFDLDPRSQPLRPGTIRMLSPRPSSGNVPPTVLRRPDDIACSPGEGPIL